MRAPVRRFYHQVPRKFGTPVAGTFGVTPCCPLTWVCKAGVSAIRVLSRLSPTGPSFHSCSMWSPAIHPSIRTPLCLTATSHGSRIYCVSTNPSITTCPPACPATYQPIHIRLQSPISLYMYPICLLPCPQPPIRSPLIHPSYLSAHTSCIYLPTGQSLLSTIP